MITDLGAAKYAMPRLVPYGPDHSAAANGAVTTGEHHGALSPESPMLWLVAIGAVTLGLASFSVAGRVGKFSASAKAG